MKPQLERKWINQPSTLQPMHEQHGTLVLVMQEDKGMSTIYFLSGPSISTYVSTSYLSNGWPEHLITNK